MAHCYNYAILQAMPDPRRGEKVNIGIVIFKGDGLDIRVSETRKLSSIANGSWDADIKAFSEIITALDDVNLDADIRLQALEPVQNKLLMSHMGWFEAPAHRYEATVRDVMKSLVDRPRRQRSHEGSSVVSEISSVLRSANLLAGKSDELKSGLVFRKYQVAEGLEADFAQQNSQFHVAAVLDLRANNPQLAQAALKSVVLDQAEAKFGKRKVHKIGVYAAAKERLPELRDNLAILKPYADDIFNWEDRHDRENLNKVFSDAFFAHHSAVA